MNFSHSATYQHEEILKTMLGLSFKTRYDYGGLRKSIFAVQFDYSLTLYAKTGS